MNKSRLEAFSDGVIAIIITIMVLELKVPHGDTLNDLLPLWPIFLSYVLSYIYIGIYWNNHHHLMQVVKHVTGPVLWANLHLLFWLSIVPFVTAWMGENHFAPTPVAAYGVVLLASGNAYYVLTMVLLQVEGSDSKLAKAVGRDVKGRISLILYIVALPIAFTSVAAACGIYALVAAIWLIPDRRIERVIAS